MPNGVRPNYRLTSKDKNNKLTGSAFDRTITVPGAAKPGGHDRATRNVDVSAFSFEKNVNRPDTMKFLHKGAGSGGHSGVESTRMMEEKVAEEVEVPVERKKEAFAKRANPPNTEFRRFYERADLPINVDQNGSKPRLSWQVEVKHLDFHHYLPLFFDGLREVEMPYSFLAEKGVEDMITHGGTKILAVIPQLIIPIKTALNTRDREVMVRVIRILQGLVKCDHTDTAAGLIGQALVPYYRQILPVFNLFKNDNTNIGDSIDYAQQKNECLGDLINETLELFELTGGEDAFINIKYLIPTYQSVVSN